MVLQGKERQRFVEFVKGLPNDEVEFAARLEAAYPELATGSERATAERWRIIKETTPNDSDLWDYLEETMNAPPRNGVFASNSFTRVCDKLYGRYWSIRYAVYGKLLARFEHTHRPEMLDDGNGEPWVSFFDCVFGDVWPQPDTSLAGPSPERREQEIEFYRRVLGDVLDRVNTPDDFWFDRNLLQCVIEGPYPVEGVIMCLEAGADPSLHTAVGTAFEHAILTGYPPTVELLIEHRANLDQALEKLGGWPKVIEKSAGAAAELRDYFRDKQAAKAASAVTTRPRKQSRSL